MTDTDIFDIRDTMKRFRTTIREISNSKIIADYDTYIVREPINKLSYDQEFGYYVSAEDIENSIKDIVKENDAILVKASHGMKFEKIVEVLKQM